MNITVYLGANKGIDDTFSIAVRELGKWIGANGHTLIYGDRTYGRTCRKCAYGRWQSNRR